MNANTLVYYKCLRSSASASRFTVKVEIGKMSYILLWIITFVEIKLGKENLRNSKIKNFLSIKVEDFLTLVYIRENFQREGALWIFRFY
jgi:hypothetical protein